MIVELNVCIIQVQKYITYNAHKSSKFYNLFPNQGLVLLYSMSPDIFEKVNTYDLHIKCIHTISPE